jgi:SAM-dependent methyltransferase
MTRAVVAREFLEAFEALPFSRDQEVEIIDLGCGLGFLSCLCAQFYGRARVTGVDTFEHESLRGSSLKKANRNARILGVSERVRFERGDLLSSDYRDMGFDLFVSNLVFHNLGRKRLQAYARLQSWMSSSSYAVVGDAFRGWREDLKRLADIFSIEKELEPNEITWAPYKVLVLSKA